MSAFTFYYFQNEKCWNFKVKFILKKFSRGSKSALIRMFKLIHFEEEEITGTTKLAALAACFHCMVSHNNIHFLPHVL